MLRLILFFLFEFLRFLTVTWSRADFTRRLWTGGMQHNVVVTKVFQAVAVRYLGRTLEMHIDRVPYDPSEIDVPTIHGIVLGDVIGAGMVAVVLEGESEAYGKIVVKLKRRHIADRIQAGLRDATWVVSCLSCIPSLRYLGLHTVHAEVEELLLTQLNFEQEVQNQLEYREMMKGTKIVVPMVYTELCTDEMIVMERLEGSRHPTNPALAADALAEATAISILKGFMHADMHIGNVIFMDDRVGLIDFGLILRLDRVELAAYAEIFTACLLKRYEAAADKAMRVYMHPPFAVRELPVETQLQLAKDIALVYETAIGNNQMFGVNDVFAMSAVVRPHGLSISPKFYKTMMSMAASDLMLKELSADPMAAMLSHLGRRLLGL